MPTASTETPPHAPRPAVPPYDPLARHFFVDPSLCFLNHGSFGAVPRVVMAEQNRLREHAEREPVRYFVEEFEPLLDAARAKVAAFVGCPADDLVFVRNATEGVNAVVRSLPLSPGDELITTTHEYNACNNALEYAAGRAGAKVVRVPLPCPIERDEQVVEAIERAVTTSTRLVMISHVTSPSGLIMPAQAVVQAMTRRGIDTLVDGAHAPGYLPLDIAEVGAAYYTANLHKWCCAPKGAAVLYVRPDRQARIKPAVLSHGENAARTDRSRFRLNFDFGGSADYSPWLAAPMAVEFVGAMVAGGWPAVMRSCAEKAWAGALAVQRRLARYEPRPLGPQHMLGAMVALTLPNPPGGWESQPRTKYWDYLQDRLIGRRGVQIPVHPVVLTDGSRRRVVRLSAAVYNSPAQYEYLAEALDEELRQEQGR